MPDYLLETISRGAAGCAFIDGREPVVQGR